MAIMRNRKLWAAAVAFASGTVLAQGCVDYGFSSGVTALDVCSILNCTGGSFFDFCNPVPLFLDCPNFDEDTNP